ncbi:MAG: PEP-CTERM sorting domain-containing protein [Gemmatimonadaceae bacterium]|nr:PEP-CTERM sorting domain-containing protein [Gemmatimonadaceae bacterium]
MRMLKTVALTLALGAFAAPTVASAQAPELGSMTFNGDVGANGSIGGYAVGPYQAHLTGYEPLLNNANNSVIWCVDWSHTAPTRSIADQYYATAFGSGDLSKTRLNDLTVYRKAAWLIEQHMAGRANYTAVNVQGTIWSMTGMGTANRSAYTNLLIGTAETSFMLRKDWYVLSDNNKDCSVMYGGRCKQYEVSNQEFLTFRDKPVVTPEPSTYALMAAGLAAMAAISKRRKLA